MRPEDIIRIEVNSEAWKEIIYAVTSGRDFSIFPHSPGFVKVKIGEGMWTYQLSTKA